MGYWWYYVFCILRGALMTQQELLNKLSTKFETVGIPKNLQSAAKFDTGIWREVEVLEVEDDGAIYKGIHFYVKNEGTKDERAFFKKDQVDPTLWRKPIVALPTTEV
jgi:hypothetical protein